MNRARLSMMLRRRMMVFLSSRGKPADGHCTKNRDLKKLVAAELGIEIAAAHKKSDEQVYEALADATLVPKARRPRTTDLFFQSREWLELRYFVLKRDGAVCACCGNAGEPSNPLQVDHIRPRSKYPDLALEPINLQVLCRQCNLGKSNIDETDWREAAE